MFERACSATPAVWTIGPGISCLADACCRERTSNGHNWVNRAEKTFMWSCIILVRAFCTRSTLCAIWSHEIGIARSLPTSLRRCPIQKWHQQGTPSHIRRDPPLPQCTFLLGTGCRALQHWGPSSLQGMVSCNWLKLPAKLFDYFLWSTANCNPTWIDNSGLPKLKAQKAQSSDFLPGALMSYILLTKNKGMCPFVVTRIFEFWCRLPCTELESAGQGLQALPFAPKKLILQEQLVPITLPDKELELRGHIATTHTRRVLHLFGMILAHIWCTVPDLIRFWDFLLRTRCSPWQLVHCYGTPLNKCTRLLTHCLLDRCCLQGTCPYRLQFPSLFCTCLVSIRYRAPSGPVAPAAQAHWHEMREVLPGCTCQRRRIRTHRHVYQTQRYRCNPLPARFLKRTSCQSDTVSTFQSQLALVCAGCTRMATIAAKWPCYTCIAKTGCTGCTSRQSTRVCWTTETRRILNDFLESDWITFWTARAPIWTRKPCSTPTVTRIRTPKRWDRANTGTSQAWSHVTRFVRARCT